MFDNILSHLSPFINQKVKIFLLFFGLAQMQKNMAEKHMARTQ